MQKQKNNLQILLLQIRDDKETMLEEFYEFVEMSGLQENQFTVLNPFITKDFDTSVLKNHDALFVGGSSDVSVLRPNEFTFLPDGMLLIRHCYHHNIPVFASCFGFQMVVQEFGGVVIQDLEHMEMGTYPIQLTEAAQMDPLFYDIPNPFWAISGHQERAMTLPENAINLAYTPLCPYHAIKIQNKPIYGFQFHPEMKTKDLITRIIRYQDKYLEDEENLQSIIENAHADTQYSNILVKNFVDRIVLP